MLYSDFDATEYKTQLICKVLRESENEGRRWRIVVIESGWSKNNVYYSPEVLRKSAPLFEGSKVFAYKFDNNFFNHLPDNLKQDNLSFAKNLAGWLENVKYEEKPNPRITADFVITDDFFRKTFKNAFKEGKKDLLGFSIDAIGDAVPYVADGRSGKKVLSIKEVSSVDIVTLPAAGGKLLRMVASIQKILEQGGKKMSPNLKQLIAIIRDNPEILGIKEDINLDEKTDEEILDLLAEALNAREAKKKKEEKKTEEPEVQEAKDKKDTSSQDLKEVEIPSAVLGSVIKMLKDKKVDDALDLLSSLLAGYYKKPGAYGYGYPAKSSEEDNEVKEKLDKVNELLEKIEVKESQMKLIEALNKSELPEFSRNRIKKLFEGKKVSEEEIQKAIAEEKEYVAKFAESEPVTVHITRDKTDKLQIAMHKMMGVEPEDNEKDDWKDVPAFRSLKEAYIQFTGDRNVDGHFDKRITEAVSTDFPQALGTSMTRRMVKEYRRLPIQDAWRRFTIIENIDNFKQQDIIRWGGLSDLPEVAEDGNYTTFTSPSEEKASYTAKKYGKILSLTREMIKNDDLRTIRKWPVKIAQAAARTLAKFVFDLLVNYGSGSINGGTIYDGKALYHADHNNLTTDTLDFDSLDAAITAIANQTEKDSNEPLGLRAKFAVVPYELRGTIKVLIDSERRPVVAASSTTGTIESVNPNYKALEPIIVPAGYLRGDKNNWYIIADPNDIETIVIGFIDGRQEPEIILQDAPNVDQVFTYDRIRYKVRHEYGGCVVDYRGFYAGIVAGLS